MDASAALADLLGVSTEVVEAVVTGPSGLVEAARSPGGERTRLIADTGAELFSAASGIRAGEPLERVQIDLERGSLVAMTDGTRAIVATTVPEPTTALVAHDLRTTLARLRHGDA
jgi:predicted regulator of Ras-like GTPase activity (Roadblock/LC7/MglB family)